MARLKSNAYILIGGASLILIIAVTSFHQYRQGHLSGFTLRVTQPNPHTTHPSDSNWTHIIWQSSKYASENHTEKERALTRTWAELNPTYRHEVMTHERMLGYAEDNFATTAPELKTLYDETTDYMMRTDVLRYMLLLRDGGVYNDLDVECLEPIDTWVPAEYREKAGVIVGIENDRLREDTGEPVMTLVVWTMMAKPNQPFIRFVLDQLILNMANLTSTQQTDLDRKALMKTTGPAATWASFKKYAGMITGTEISYRNFTGMTKPRLVGEVLVLPIWAFGAQHQVRNAGLVEKQGRVLVKHWFANSWHKDHEEKGT